MDERTREVLTLYGQVLEKILQAVPTSHDPETEEGLLLAAKILVHVDAIMEVK